MTWGVRWEEGAADELARLTRREPRRARNVRQQILTLAETGHGDVKKLEGRRDEWRLRVGSWRVTFTYDRPARELIILALEPRRSAYRD